MPAEEKRKIKYLVVQPLGGESGLQHVGIFHSDTAEDAAKQAKTTWHTVGAVTVFELSSLPEGWSYYI